MEIYEFQKNALEKVKMQIQQYKGNLVLDTRVYFLVPGTANEWRRSDKGLCVSVDRLDDLLNGLEVAKRRLNKPKK